MEKVDFAAEGNTWLLSAGSVLQRGTEPVSRIFWSSLSALANQASQMDDAHIFVRYEFELGGDHRRFFGILLPREKESDRESWHLAAAAMLDDGYEKETPFLGVDPPAILRELPTRSYIVGGQSVVCSFTLTTLVESLLFEKDLAGVEWSLQFNARRHRPTGEELRKSRKVIARLEAMPGIPERFVREQRELLTEAENTPWSIVEMIAAPNEEAFHRVISVIDRKFEEAYRHSNFSALDWNVEPSNITEFAWVTGLVAELPSTGLEQPVLPQLHADEIVAALWTVRAPSTTTTSAAQPRVGKSTSDVFISYSTRDAEAAFETCRFLENRDISCWIAPRNISPGSEWPTEIVAGIKSSTFTVVLVSEGSNLSKYVMRELEISVKESHPIIPVRLERCNLRDSIQFFLSSQQWIDATAPPFESHLERLAETLSRLIQ